MLPWANIPVKCFPILSATGTSGAKEVGPCRTPARHGGLRRSDDGAILAFTNIRGRGDGNGATAHGSGPRRSHRVAQPVGPGGVRASGEAGREFGMLQDAQLPPWIDRSI